MEFALVAPLLFLVILGMIEFGRMIMVQQVITNASREGARRGVLDGATTSEVTTAVKSYLTGATVKDATVTVTPNPPSSAGFGEPVTVTVSVPFNKVTWLPKPMFLSGKTLTAQSIMRRESSQ